jgi:electron transport complex protein RnfA
MVFKELVLLFIGASLVNNFLLARFLGTCPFLGVSSQVKGAASMGVAVTGVMLGVTLVSWPVYHLILAPLNLGFLQYIVFILVIASFVQMLEQIIKVLLPALYKAFGIYLALITTNCSILGLAIIMIQKDYNLVSSLVFALGAGAGFTLAMVIMAGIREAMDKDAIPVPFRGNSIILITAGIMAMAFAAFSGMVPM